MVGGWQQESPALTAAQPVVEVHFFLLRGHISRKDHVSIATACSLSSRHHENMECLFALWMLFI